jgi:TP901 family phage tail tape measure protein
MSDEIKQVFSIEAADALQQLQQLDAGFSKFNSTVQGLTNTLNQFNGSANQVTSAAKNIGSAFQSNLGGANAAVERLSLSFGLLSRVVTTQLIVRSLSQMRNAFEDAAESAIKFETALSEIQTIDPGSTIQGLAHEVRGLSDAFNVPLLDVAKAKYEALSNGFTTAAQQSDVLSAAFKFSKVALTDSGKSLDLISGTLNAFGKDSAEAEAIAAKFFKTIQLGAIRGPELATALGRVSPIAAELGVSLDEVLAQFAALTISGVKPAEAATQISAAMTALIKPSKDAEEALRKLGFASPEALIQAKGLTGGLQALISTTDGSAAAIGRLIPNVCALKDVLAVNQRGDVFRDFQAQISGINTGEFNNLVGQRLSTDSERVTSDLNKLKNALTELGGQFVSVAADVSKFTGGADTLIAVVRPFEPVLLAGAAALGVYATAALRGATANAAFVDSFKGASAGLLLGAGAAAGGNFIGNQFFEAINRPQREFDKAADAAIDAFRKSAAERIAAEQDADAKLLQGTLNAIHEQEKFYLQDVKNAQAAGKQLVENADKTADAIIRARERFGSQLNSSLNTSREQSQASASRVANLRQDQSDNSFNQQLSRLNDAQQVFALIQRSASTASQAAAAMEKAAASGNQQQLQQALSLFGRAQQEGQQAKQIADRTGNRALEANAIRNVSDNLQRQINAEQQLQKIEADRAAKIQQLQEKQQAALDVLREQQNIINKNTNPLDAIGNLLSPEQLAKQQAAIQTALAKINSQKLSGSDLQLADAAGLGQQARDFNLKLSNSVARINFDATAGIAQIEGQLNAAFAKFKLKINIDVDALSQAVGKALNNPAQVEAAFKELQSKIGELKQQGANSTANDSNIAKLKTDLASISAAVDSTGRALARLAGPGLLFKSQTDQVATLKRDLDTLTNDPALNGQKISQFFAKVAELKNSALQGNVAKNVGLAADVENLSRAAEILQRLQQSQQQKPVDTSQLQPFESLLRELQAANPAGQFQSSAQSIGSAVSPAQSIAAAWERAAIAAERTAAAAAASGGAETAALGGFIQRFASGGFAASGTDTIPAMLSPRESVINARQSERFHPQIVAMNAGVTPSFPTTHNHGGNVSIGDININEAGDAKVTAREVVSLIRREMRRGTSNLN